MSASSVAGSVALMLIAGAVLAAADGSRVVQRHAYVMGTRVFLSVHSPTRAEGLDHLDRALEVLEDTERQLSTWRADSWLSAVNRSPLNIPLQVDASLCRLLASLADWQEATGGAFDPAIGSLLRAWDVRGAGRVPSETDLILARSRAGFAHLRVERRECLVTRLAAVTLDAGGFGKGEALDRAASVLAGEHWMIDLGGQVAVSGSVSPGQGWAIAIADPRDRSEPVLTVDIIGGSLATSGSSERDRRVGGRRVGHILDPRVGRPAAFFGSVTVWHESALVADILSTALFVMGPDDGLRWAERHGLAVCYLEPDKRGGVGVTVTMTGSFRPLVVG